VWLDSVPDVSAQEVTSTKYLKSHLVPPKPAQEKTKTKSKRAPGQVASQIGRPYNVSHNVHVAYTPDGYQVSFFCPLCPLCFFFDEFW